MAIAKTSEHGAYIRGLGAGADLGDKNPVDTHACRDLVINNLNHLSDVHGQQLINLVLPSGQYEMTLPAPTTTYQRIASIPSMFVPIHHRHDGQSRRLIVEMRASISAAGTANFRVVFKPGWFTGTFPPSSAVYTWVADTTTTSTTPTDLSFTPMFFRPPAVPVVALFEVWAKSSVSTSLPRVHHINARAFIGEE